MKATFKPCTLHGTIDAPPSKSMAHRYLIGAALSGHPCTLEGVDYSEDILATMDCLRALGAEIETDGDTVRVDPSMFMKTNPAVLECRESGSTLRFFLPLALCVGKPVVLCGSKRLMERPLTVYEEMCNNRGFLFDTSENAVTVCGRLQSGRYAIRGDISSQFITGLIFALVHIGGQSVIDIIPPFESRSYVNLTVSALHSFGICVVFTDENTIRVDASEKHGFSGRIEGDYSNAAFLDAFNAIGSDVRIDNLLADSLQGDRCYTEYFQRICNGTPTLDISDCPDLGPILFALAALKNGATFIGTDRLKIKESDRATAMHEELLKLGGGILLGENTAVVPKQSLQYGGRVLDGHNDHRIVMALSVILSVTGGCIDGVQSVRKSYPGFFHDLQSLGAKVELL